MFTIDLKDKVALVTGGGTGIGRAIAIALAAEGMRVVVCGRRAAPLEAVVATIQESGATALALTADVSGADAVAALVQQTLKAYGQIDILVNNAGIGGGGPIHAHSIEQWDQIMAVNLRGPFLLARAVLPLMRDQKSGHIINISSESGLEYYPGNGAYGVAKHALNALGEYIQRENQALGIRVDTICPGMVVTEMTEDLPGINLDLSLDPAEVADLVRWLVTRQRNVKIGRPVLIQTMANPWAE